MISFFIFFFGLAVGSFLNAVIYRMGEPFDYAQGKSAFKGRSHCPHCRHTLSWQDLIPVASFLMLKGRCRYCKERISLQYPIVEIFTAFIFLQILNDQIPMPNEPLILQIFTFLYFLTIACLLIIIFVYDLKYYLIPDKILFPAIGIVFAYRIFEFLDLEHWDLFGIWDLGFGISAPLANSLFSAFASALFFFLIFALSKGRAMGFGDVKLAAFMGLFLGWPNILVALFLAFLLGAIIGVALVALKKRGMKSEVPFGPFLVAGTFLALLWGELLVQWYWNRFLVQ